MLKDYIIQKFLKGALKSRVKTKIRNIYLFGSRARGEEKPYSDYDFLLVMKERDEKIVDKLYDIAVDLLLETGKVISLKIFKEKDFNRLSGIPTPFMKKVLKEGIKLA